MDKILKVIPRERRTFLFSATMTKKVHSSPLLFCGGFCRFARKNNKSPFGLQVQKLQRAALKDPVKCAVSTKYSTVEKLQQYYIFIPSKYKVWYIECTYLIYMSDSRVIQQYCLYLLHEVCYTVLWQDCYLVSILNELAGNSFIIFCSTCNNAQRLALLLRNLGITAIPLHGQLSQVELHRK